MTWIETNWGVVFAALFALDQVLAAIPSVKSNSVFQLFTNILGSLAPKA